MVDVNTKNRKRARAARIVKDWFLIWADVERQTKKDVPLANGEPPGERMSDSQEEVNTYTVRLELHDKPGELLRALQPIADNEGNLLSIFHERGNVTPRGHIPIEIDLEATPERFDTIVDALRDEGFNVTQAGAERYSQALTLVLVGDIVRTDFSDTLSRIQDGTEASVVDISLSAPEGTNDVSSARLRLATKSGEDDAVLGKVRSIADEKDLRVIEPLGAGGAS